MTYLILNDDLTYQYIIPSIPPRDYYRSQINYLKSNGWLLFQQIDEFQPNETSDNEEITTIIQQINFFKQQLHVFRSELMNYYIAWFRSIQQIMVISVKETERKLLSNEYTNTNGICDICLQIDQKIDDLDKFFMKYFAVQCGVTSKTKTMSNGVPVTTISQSSEPFNEVDNSSVLTNTTISSVSDQTEASDNIKFDSTDTTDIINETAQLQSHLAENEFKPTNQVISSSTLEHKQQFHRLKNRKLTRIPSKISTKRNKLKMCESKGNQPNTSTTSKIKQTPASKVAQQKCFIITNKQSLQQRFNEIINKTKNALMNMHKNWKYRQKKTLPSPEDNGAQHSSISKSRSEFKTQLNENKLPEKIGNHHLTIETTPRYHVSSNIDLLIETENLLIDNVFQDPICSIKTHEIVGILKPNDARWTLICQTDYGEITGHVHCNAQSFYITCSTISYENHLQFYAQSTHINEPCNVTCGTHHSEVIAFGTLQVIEEDDEWQDVHGQGETKFNFKDIINHYFQFLSKQLFWIILGLVVILVLIFLLKWGV